MRHEWFKIIGSVLLGILCALALLMLDGCQPYMTYDELEAGASSDPKIQKRLEKFEADVEKADKWLATREFCARTTNCHMFCKWGGTHARGIQDRKEFADVTVKVYWYRKIRGSCSFTTRDGWR